MNKRVTIIFGNGEHVVFHVKNLTMQREGDLITEFEIEPNEGEFFHVDTTKIDFISVIDCKEEEKRIVKNIEEAKKIMFFGGK